MDRFLSLQRITPSSLQLLGITCILIAAKYYERFPPQVSPDWIDNDIFCSSVNRTLALKQGMVCFVNVGYLTGRILHCVFFFFFTILHQVSDLVYLTDNTYKVEQVFTMERIVLRKFGFDLNTTDPVSTMEHFLQIAGADRMVNTCNSHSSSKS